jgi:predicted AAA+ superfamily ATPase
MDIFWEKKGWEEEDPHLLKLKAMPFLRPFPDLNIKKGLYILRGPRQVGKTTWLKKLLAQSIREGKECFYISCEQIDDYKQLSILLKSLRTCDVVYLDEISFVDQWARSIKTEVERTESPTFVITGSNTTDLRKGGERLPGRFGDGGEFELLPMSFDVFCKMREQIPLRNESKKELLLSYFKVGGFPLSLLEIAEDAGKEIPTKAQDTYWKWLVGDVVRAGKSEVFLRDIIGQLAIAHGTPISLQTLAKKTQIGSHNTVSEYIQLLEDCFALSTVYAIDPNSGSRKYRSEKKYYFRDPLIYWIAISQSHYKVTDNFNSQLAELVAAEDLIQKYGGVGYYRSKKGEVDFYKHQSWAIEIKWKDIATDISKAFFEVPVSEKIVWTTGNFMEEYPRTKI